MIGQTLAGRFTVTGLVGVGSMGKVYRAVQRGTERNVALKVLRPERARDEKAKARFLREARACSSLASPHTVRVFDFGESDDGDLFLAMELLEGESLGQRLKRDGRLAVLSCIETALATCKSLEEAHAKGLIHRDLKPANLFYARVTTGGGGFDEILKVLDFGGAKFIAPEGKPLNAMDTLEGFVVGTPRYMSPEQAEGKTLDGRSDLYSLGAVLYHMLTGRPPFTDDDPEVVLSKQIRTTPEPLSRVCPDAEIPPELEGLVLRAMAKSPDLRPKDATALAQELAALVDAPLSTRLSAGVLRASLPPPAGAQTTAPHTTPSSPSGSGRTMRASVPSIPAGATSSPSGSGTSRAQAPLAPSTPGAFAPGASSSGAPRATPPASTPTESTPRESQSVAAPSRSTPDASGPTRKARRSARWAGIAGALVVVAGVTWLGLNAGRSPASTIAPANTASSNGTSMAAVAPATNHPVGVRVPQTVAPLLTAHAVPVEALPRARFESAPRRAMPKSHVVPARSSEVVAADPSPPFPVPSAPAPLPAATAPPSATASSPYHTFE